MEESKKGKGPIVIIVILSILVLALAATVVFLIINNKPTNTTGNANKTTETTTVAQGDTTKPVNNTIDANIFSDEEYWPLLNVCVLTNVSYDKEYINDTTFKYLLALSEAHYYLKSDEIRSDGVAETGAARFKRSELEQLFKSMYNENMDMSKLPTNNGDFGFDGRFGKAFDDNYIYSSYPTGMGPDDTTFEFNKVSQKGDEYTIEFNQVEVTYKDDDYDTKYLGKAYLKYKITSDNKKQYTSFIVKKN